MRHYLPLIFLALASAATAQTVHVCQKDGKRIMSDQPCDTFGARTKEIRHPDSYAPLSTVGGLTEGERRMAADYKARDQADDARRNAEIDVARQQRNQQEAENVSRCAALDAEKRSIVAQLRQNSTPWLNERHKEVNDEMYRRRCKTL